MFCLYLSGWADEEELIAHIERLQKQKAGWLAIRPVHIQTAAEVYAAHKYLPAATNRVRMYQIFWNCSKLLQKSARANKVPNRIGFLITFCVPPAFLIEKWKKELFATETRGHEEKGAMFKGKENATVKRNYWPPRACRGRAATKS
jgi:hypothetical protein